MDNSHEKLQTVLPNSQFSLELDTKQEEFRWRLLWSAAKVHCGLKHDSVTMKPAVYALILVVAMLLGVACAQPRQHRERYVSRKIFYADCPALALATIRDQLTAALTVQDANKWPVEPCDSFISANIYNMWKLDNGSFLDIAFSFPHSSFSGRVHRITITSSDGFMIRRVFDDSDAIKAMHLTAHPRRVRVR